eukprot:2147831-Amphidinium_carterae.1
MVDQQCVAIRDVEVQPELPSVLPGPTLASVVLQKAHAHGGSCMCSVLYGPNKTPHLSLIHI